MKITEAELNEKIAELRGEFIRQKPYSYIGDMNLAGQLLDELPGAGANHHLCLSQGPLWIISWRPRCNRKYHRHTKLPIAICLAWLQWKTGVVYEVIDNETDRRFNKMP